MVGVKGVLWVFVWCSGLLLVSLPFMMGICGLYIFFALFMSFKVIGMFMILFFQRIILVSVLIFILQVVGVFLLFPIL